NVTRYLPMASESDLRIIYVPCGSEDAVATLARRLLERRLIACANIYPSRSIYRWKGEVVDELEYVIFAKTTAALATEAAAAGEELHAYEIPCVLVLEPAAANAPYATWVAGEVGEPAARGSYG
ncbi:MAG TPA: divalent cation tolerance protein CutA, partial [Chloroflexia bacterium]|nr:divalent cation tolerance protein CutA [Chloroflexia bacterium]